VASELHLAECYVFVLASPGSNVIALLLLLLHQKKMNRNLEEQNETQGLNSTNVAAV
jgi:hypothetical protein